ncbi:MAG: TonB-dependent receptor [Acidobacteria bacterium]|nr:TonB-dependent receptor [Acidobacteriota bacterium]
MKIVVVLSACALFAQEKQSVVVTGAYEPIPLEESERAVRAIAARPLIPLSASVVDFLHLDPSLDLRGRAPNGVQSGLSIRGGSFGQTLVLWNGFRLNSVQTSNLSMDLPIPLEAISQVEVLKGSGSTLYGSDATAGVLNVITTVPETTEVKLRAGIGNFGTQQQHASVAFRGRGIAQQFTFARDFSTGFMPNRDYRNLSVASQSSYRRTSILLGINDRPFGAEQFYGNFNSWERTKNWFAGIRQGIGERTEASFAYRRHTDLFVLYRDRPQVYTNRHIVETYQGALRRSDPFVAGGRLHYGAEVIGDRIDSNNLGQHSRARSAFYAAYDVRALKRFSLTLGIRDEIYRNFAHQWNPSVGAGYWVSSRAKLRASVSRAFRLPTYTDLYYRDPANEGNPLLRPERAWSIEGGLDLGPVGVTVFQRREKDGIDFVRTSPTSIWRATNFQALNFTGVEAHWRRTIARVHRVELAYTGLNGAQSVLNGLQSKYVFNYPRHSGVASWQAAFGDGWIARSRLGALERFGRSPYAVWDLYGSWQKHRVRPYLQLANLTSTRYEEFVGIRMPGRSFVGGIEIRR